MSYRLSVGAALFTNLFRSAIKTLERERPSRSTNFAASLILQFFFLRFELNKIKNTTVEPLWPPLSTAEGNLRKRSAH